jgi:hypothetical protein
MRRLSNSWQEEPQYMSAAAHLQNLQRKHLEIETELQKALAHPSATDTEINTIKRRKLTLKDEIERLQKTNSKG